MTNFEKSTAKAFADHVNRGGKLIIRTRMVMKPGDQIPYVQNDGGERFHQRFVIVRETNKAEFLKEMTPGLDERGAHLPGQRFYEVMAD